MHWLCSLVALVVSLAALGGSLAHAEREVRLDDALLLARQNNRDLKAARERLGAAHVAIEQARVPLLPTVAVQGRYTHNYKTVQLDPRTFGVSPTVLAKPTLGLGGAISGSTADPALKAAVDSFNSGLSQSTAAAQARFDGAQPIVITPSEQLDFVASATVPLVAPAALYAYAAARKGYLASEADFHASEAQLLVATAQAFFAAAGTDELLAARHDAVRVAQLTFDNARVRFDAGSVPKLDATRARIALLRAQQAEREAVDQRATAYALLATVLQLREPFHVVPPIDQDLASLPSEEPAELVTRALALRPELTAFRLNLEAATASVGAAKWRYSPTLSAFGNVRAFNYGGFSGDNYAWAVGAQIDWLLYDGGARDAQRHLYEAQRRDSELRFGQLRDTVSDDVQNARRGVLTRRAALETARSASELSREALGQVRVLYEAGAALQLDLLAAQDNLVAADLGVAQARFDLALADLQLRRATGAFPGPGAGGR